MQINEGKKAEPDQKIARGKSFRLDFAVLFFAPLGNLQFVQFSPSLSLRPRVPSIITHRRIQIAKSAHEGRTKLGLMHDLLAFIPDFNTLP